MGEAAKKWEPKVPDYANQKPVDIEKRKKETMEGLKEGSDSFAAGKFAREFERNNHIIKIEKPSEGEIKAVGDGLEKAYQEFFVNYQQIKAMKEKIASGELSAARYKELQTVALEEVESFMRNNPDHGIDELKDKMSKINNLQKAIIELGEGL